jgi:hypothetical protein
MSFSELFICFLVALFVLRRDDFDRIIDIVKSLLSRYQEGREVISKAVHEKNTQELAKDIDNYISKIKSNIHGETEVKQIE